MRNSFYNDFKRFVEKEQLFDPEEKILLAVSGGIDSVVMAHLFHRADFHFAIAHCNFQLRGSESDGDEDFVRQLSKNLNVPVYVKHFDTEIYAAEYNISIQMAARELRYAWFEELLQEHNYHFLATAHHKDDNAETVLLNLIKGSVIKGLRGIQPKQNHIIRPLLFTTKKEIAAYASHKKYDHREDSSNPGNKYQRNLIRNEVIPILEQINPDLSETIYLAADRRSQLEKWILGYSEKFKTEIVKQTEGEFRVSIADLKKQDIPAQIFFDWVSEYGFNYVQCAELYDSIASTENKTFISKNFRMIKDRDIIRIEKISSGMVDNVLIEKDQSITSCGNQTFSLSFMHFIDIENFNNPSIAYLNEEKLQFPLLVRKWEHGDSFKPFGMRGNKKISDFLTDLKLSLSEKENQLVVCSGNEICWVVGHRIDEHFKVNEHTKKVLKIELLK